MPGVTWAGGSRADRWPFLFVHGVWLALLAGALAAIALWGRNLPLSEDWLTVAPLTGHEPDLLGWLWAQNNEHRVPVPRLLYLALLRLSGGDYRSGMVFNALALGALSFALIHVARRARGASHPADAFFPLVLLHLGHWENLVWGWQLQIVLSVVLTCVLLLVIARDGVADARGMLSAGFCLLLLPLTGANGVVMAVALSPWFAWRGWRTLGVDSATRRTRRAARALLGCTAAAVALCALYFVGYERPRWYSASPGPVATAKTMAKLVAIGLGPAATYAWRLSAPVVAAILVSGALLLIRPGSRTGREDRARRIGLLVFLAAGVGLSLAIAWGRAGAPPHPRWDLPIRYALLAVPLLLGSYFAITLYAPSRVRAPASWALLALAVLVLPLNTRGGFFWRDWYLAGADHVLADLRAGEPLPAIADRHYPFLMHWNRDFLLSRLEMLRAARMGPFSELATDSVAARARRPPERPPR